MKKGNKAIQRAAPYKNGNRRRKQNSQITIVHNMLQKMVQLFGYMDQNKRKFRYRLETERERETEEKRAHTFTRNKM